MTYSFPDAASYDAYDDDDYEDDPRDRHDWNGDNDPDSWWASVETAAAFFNTHEQVLS